MFTLKTYNNIAAEGLAILDDLYAINESNDYDAILLRSHSLHDITFDPRLKAIARAGAGVNNIPVDKCTEEGIVVFNTPGANANAVKELVLASLFLSVRPIIRGSAWVQQIASDDISKEVEANKKQFAGTELDGKTLGVIGLGNIGSQVANDAYRLGMNVIGYDPYVSVSTAWNISRRVQRAVDVDEILLNADFITMHTPLTKDTANAINSTTLAKMKKGAVLINFSRGELVDNDAILESLNQNHLGMYITDFADKKLLNNPNILVLPHLGASTQEAEVNCARMAVKTLRYFLETGNIINSVNFPNTELNFASKTRFTFIHKNVPKMLGNISNVAGQFGVNIDNMINRNSGNYAYTIVDVPDHDPKLLADLKSAFDDIDGMIKSRIIRNLNI